jgi:hypothetical protein
MPEPSGVLRSILGMVARHYQTLIVLAVYPVPLQRVQNT